MHRYFALAPLRDERGEHNAAAHAAVEPRPGPDLAPGIAGDQILEVAGEVGRAGDCRVDVIVAEHLAPDAHSLVVGHGCSFSGFGYHAR